jgi:hypothetical protein
VTPIKANNLDFGVKKKKMGDVLYLVTLVDEADMLP